MSDILKQIQALQEQFSNLFEVEGLGNPAVDVPPSQNKIKRDRKTKDGKVELVSVEDELFPYDGNKKEQYRQKILNTINGMIQGTATLEDLLQIVRQKKAPLKEAMEILERISNENVEKVIGAWNAEYLKQNMPSKTRKDFEEKVREKSKKKAPLKEAMEILEKHVFPKLAVEQGNAKYLEADKKKNEAVRLSKKAFDKLNKKIKELEGKGIDTDVDIEPHVTYGNGPKKEYQQALKTADDLHDKAREADREFTKADNNQRKLRIEGNKGVIKREFEPVPTKKGDNFNFKKVLVKNEALEEAIEILEDLESTITKKYGPLFGDKTSHHGAYLHKQAIANQVDEIIGAAKRNLPDEEKNSTMAIDREANKIEAKRANTKNKKGERKTRLLKAAYGRDKEEYEKYLKRHPELVRENLEDQIEKKFKKGEISLDKAFDLAKKIESKMSQDKNNQEREDKIQKEAWKIGPNVEKASQQRQIGKAIRRNERKNALTFEALEEAMKLMEEVINEVSLGKWKQVAASSLPKRKEAFEKTVDNAKKSWDNYNELSKKHPEDEYALYKKAEADTEAQDGAEEKADHAYAVTRLKTHDKANANKAIKAAKKVQDKREDEFGRNPEKRTFLRSGKANQLASADPVKSRNESLEEAINILSELTEADHCARKSNPVVKITDKNYSVAHGKGLPGPFNKDHVGNYIVYNKDTDASYLVTPDNWQKSKIKKDLEKQGKVFETFEEFEKVLELFDRPDLLDDIDTALGSPVKKTFKKVVNGIVAPRKEKKGTQKKAK